MGDNASRKKGFSRWYTIGRGGCHYYSADICDEAIMSVGSDYITNLITERALTDIEELSERQEPFYLSVHYTAPHSPWNRAEHPKEYLEMYRECRFNSTPDLPVHPLQVRTCPVGDTPEKRRENLTGYYAAVTAADAGIGRILDLLEKRNIEKDTIVIFTADNGMNMGHHGIWGKGNGTYPPNMFETSVKVPFIVCIPGNDACGTICHTPASQYDIYQTILELAGCTKSTDPYQPGHSLLPQLKCPSALSDREVVIYDEYGKTRMIKKDGYKYVHRYGTDFHEFYDLAQDPDESQNLYGKKEYSQSVIEMRREMEEWFAKYSLPEYDGTKHRITGNGQRDFCYKENAFE